MVGPAYDVIVVGVGGSGSAILYHLAQRGLRVLGLEQFDLGHALGSSHGLTRIIRLAYHEDPAYVPLVRRSYELWRDLERRTGTQLLTITGCLSIGPPGSVVVEGCLESARVHRLQHDVLTAEEVMARYPGFRLPPQMKAVLQPDGGFLEPEKCIMSHVGEALRLGAELHARERVKAWRPSASGVEVVTSRGTYRGGKLVVSAGAWASKLLRFRDLRLSVERQVVGWFHPKDPELFRRERMPVWMLAERSKDYAPGYGFPIHGLPGFKLGVLHHRREVVDPDRLEREPNREDEQVLRRFLRRYFPAADGPMLALQTCLFTNTTDQHFVLDVHPQYKQVIVVSCCSGHGFKFCSVIGEVVADLSERGTTSHDITLFRASRFGSTASPAG